MRGYFGVGRSPISGDCLPSIVLPVLRASLRGFGTLGDQILFGLGCDLLVHPASAAALGRIFFAVKRPHMRRVSIPIRSCDSQLLLVRIDPLPQHFAVAKPLQAGFPLHAHEIGCRPCP